MMIHGRFHFGITNDFSQYLLPDIDECETGIHNCGPQFKCQNTQGSFRCVPTVNCGSGFIQDALGNCIGNISMSIFTM